MAMLADNQIGRARRGEPKGVAYRVFFTREIWALSTSCWTCKANRGLYLGSVHQLLDVQSPSTNRHGLRPPVVGCVSPRESTGVLREKPQGGGVFSYIFQLSLA